MKKTIRLTESDLVRLVKRVINEQIEEQTALGTLANVEEIKYEMAKNLVGLLPSSQIAAMITSAVSGDAKSVSQILDQQKARLGRNYQSLKTAITKGDVAKNLSNLAGYLKQAESQIESGLGNKSSRQSRPYPTRPTPTTGPTPTRNRVRPVD